MVSSWVSMMASANGPEPSTKKPFSIKNNRFVGRPLVQGTPSLSLPLNLREKSQNLRARFQSELSPRPQRSLVFAAFVCARVCGHSVSVQKCACRDFQYKNVGGSGFLYKMYGDVV